MEDWFIKLRDYFPAKEMKSEIHMKELLHKKSAFYKIEEGPQYILAYFEKPDFLFIDYILVSSSSRGSGLGSKVISNIQKKNKLILLEVDPISSSDPESAKRVRFYQKQNFRKASAIQYERIHPVTGEQNVMDIFYWSDSKMPEEWVLKKMKEIYQEVHAFKSEEIYGTPPQPAEEVLSLKKYSRTKQAE